MEALRARIILCVGGDRGKELQGRMPPNSRSLQDQSSPLTAAPVAEGSFPPLIVNLHGLLADHQTFRSRVGLISVLSGSLRVEGLSRKKVTDICEFHLLKK